MRHAPYLILETLEHLFSSQFSLNMNIEQVEAHMETALSNNLKFLTSISKKLPQHSGEFEKYMAQQQQFKKKWHDLIAFYRREMDSFLEKFKQGNPD